MLGYVCVVVSFFSCDDGDIFSSYVWPKDAVVRLGEYRCSDAVDLRCGRSTSWYKGSVLRSLMAVPETPVLIAVPPALLVNWVGWELPPVLVRPVELLSDGMISTMLVALGAQLAAGLPRLDADMAVASAVRLIGGPALALGLAAPIGIEGIAHSTGVLQAPCRRRCWPRSSPSRTTSSRPS